MLDQDSTVRVIMVTLDKPDPLMPLCSRMMRGKTVRRNGQHRASWTKPCPNRAVLTHRGRAYCALHAPSAAKDSID